MFHKIESRLIKIVTFKANYLNYLAFLIPRESSTD